MSISFRCEHCHRQVNAPDGAAGKRGKCPYCGQSTYVRAPVAEEDLVPLVPLDDKEERRRQREMDALMEQERLLLAERDETANLPPLEHRENLAGKDLHHLVVNYCMDMADSNLERATMHAAQLKKFGAPGVEAVDDFLTGKALEQVLDSIPRRVLQGFLTQLRKLLMPMDD